MLPLVVIATSGGITLLKFDQDKEILFNTYRAGSRIHGTQQKPSCCLQCV